MSVFAMQDGQVFHTYSAFSRGLDALWNMWQWLDRAPLGRNECELSWFHRHDRYGARSRPWPEVRSIGGAAIPRPRPFIGFP